MTDDALVQEYQRVFGQQMGRIAAKGAAFDAALESFFYDGIYERGRHLSTTLKGGSGQGAIAAIESIDSDVWACELFISTSTRKLPADSKLKTCAQELYDALLEFQKLVKEAPDGVVDSIKEKIEAGRRARDDMQRQRQHDFVEELKAAEALGAGPQIAVGVLIALTFIFCVLGYLRSR